MLIGSFSCVFSGSQTYSDGIYIKKKTDLIKKKNNSSTDYFTHETHTIMSLINQTIDCLSEKVGNLSIKTKKMKLYTCNKTHKLMSRRSVGW